MTADTQINPWVKRVNAFASAILVVAIAYVSMQLIYTLLGAGSSTRPSLYGSSGGGLGLPTQRKIDTSSIAMWNLFGKEGQAPVKETAKDVEAPTTNLNLELQGVFMAPEESRSTAMIAESRKDSELYHIGDKIPGNASLAAVFPDRVLLNRNGELEALYFPENSASSRSRGASSRSSSDSSSSRAGRVDRSALQSSGGRKNRADSLDEATKLRMKKSRAAVASKMVSTIQEQLGDNPEQILTQFGLASNGGQGYVVTDNVNPMLKTLGIKSGDVVLKVNGKTVGNPSQDIAGLAEEIITTCNAKASVVRDGTEFELEGNIPGC